eukprot:TRINITY_DN72716_c0_g1_i1.p1 TRINITY_DN72716_c0_g1~~TRINITY_DN72716_c0_g1_i1.p1  ORF type:complete len:672 (-),score=155.04 TRINITY_DN72716_c0_g1_i1:127-2070(-)
MATGVPEIAAPLEVIDRLFECSVSGGNQAPAEFGEKAHFIRTLGLEDEDRLAQIPCLNDAGLISSLPPLSLVRYRAMVQDTFEPEFYASLLEERSEAGSLTSQSRLVTTKYRDFSTPRQGFNLFELEGIGAGLASRGVCYCVPLPGEAAWARDASARWARERHAGAEAAAKAAAAPAVGGGASASQAGSATKRSRPDEDVDMGESSIPVAAEAQRARVASAPMPATTTQLCSANEFGLNFPLPWEERHGQGSAAACLVKFYDSDANTARICDIIEVVGVLCVDPQMADFSSTTPLAQSAMGRDARDPSTSLVPRLHAIHVRKLPFYHPMLPYTVQWLNEARLADAYQRSFAGGPAALSAVREAALAHLTGALAGDVLAAHYVLMLLVSRAFGKNAGQKLGSWSLCLSTWPAGHPVKDLHAALALVAARTAHLEVSSETLNNRKWYPRKDEVANRLVAGQLQLAPGTVVLLDESTLSEGQVAPAGVKALIAIGNLVKESELACDYMYDVKVPLELSPIIVTTQKRSILKDVAVALPVRPAVAATAAPPASAAAGAGLEAVRLLIALVTRAPKPLAVPQDVVTLFGDDFVNIRQQLNVAPELCGTWMCLARAYCLWHGEESLAATRWAGVLGLEKQRLERCKEDGLFSS